MSNWTSRGALTARVVIGNPVDPADVLDTDENIRAMAERAPNGPIVGVPERVFITSSQTWTIPEFVNAIRVIAIGGGGGIADGGDTVVTYDSQTMTAGGGVASSNFNNGGTSTGGDINLTGEPGGLEVGGSAPPYGYGGIRNDGLAVGYGAGGGRVNLRGGGAGAYAEKRFVVDPIDSAVSITIGAGGTDNGNPETAGRDGLVIIEY